MLDINKNTKKITFVQGDTVDFDVTASNYAFETGDTVHFTVKKIGGDNVIEKEITTFTDGVANTVKDVTLDISSVSGTIKSIVCRLNWWSSFSPARIIIGQPSNTLLKISSDTDLATIELTALVFYV